MPKLRNLVRDTHDLTIPSDGDDPLEITFRKGFMSPDLADKFARADDMPAAEQLGVLADMVAGAVVRWNLTDDDDDPIPPTRKAIGGLDAGFLQFVAEAMQEALKPDPLSESDSNNGSSPAAELEPRRIGMAS